MSEVRFVCVHCGASWEDNITLCACGWPLSMTVIEDPPDKANDKKPTTETDDKQPATETEDTTEHEPESEPEPKLSTNASTSTVADSKNKRRALWDGPLQIQAEKCAYSYGLEKRENAKAAIVEALVGYIKMCDGTYNDAAFALRVFIQEAKPNQKHVDRALRRVFLERVKHIWDDVLLALKVEVFPLKPGTNYFTKGPYTCRLERTKDGTRKVFICNFIVRVINDVEVVREGGLLRFYDLEIDTANNETIKLRVPADELTNREVQKTFARFLGAQASIMPKEEAHVMLSAFSWSRPVKRKDVATMGWCRVVEDGIPKHVFVLPKTVIGGSKDSVTLHYDPQVYGPFVDQYQVPNTPDLERLPQAVDALVSILQAAPIPEAFYILYSHVLAAPMLGLLSTNSRTALYVFGVSGAYKSTSIQQAHRIFGKFPWQAPQSFASTVNALEPALAIPRHLPAHADDLKEGITGMYNVVRMIQAYSGGQGRGRFNIKTLDQTPGAVIRSNLIVSAENTIEGQTSTEARTVALGVARGRIPLSFCQKVDTYADVLPQLGSWLLNRLVANYAEAKIEVEETFESIRTELVKKVPPGGHMRVPESLALVAVGLRLTLRWLEDDNLLDSGTADSLRDVFQGCIDKTLGAQLANVNIQNAAEIFIGTLQDLLIARDDLWVDFVPPNERGTLLGWADNNGELRIIASIAFGEVQKHLRSSNRELAFKTKDIFTALFEQGYTETPEPQQYRKARCLHFKEGKLSRKADRDATGVPNDKPSPGNSK